MGAEKIKAGKKKIKPYPIEGTIEANGAKKEIKVIYVSSLGVIGVLGTHMVNVGEYCLVTFKLPAIDEWIRCNCRVLKTYDRATETSTVERLAEFHFEKLGKEHKSIVEAFMRAIGQSDRAFQPK